MLEALRSKTIKTNGWIKHVPTPLAEADRKPLKRGKTTDGRRTLIRCMLDNDNLFAQENGLATRRSLSTTGLLDLKTGCSDVTIHSG
jgi:hypothetical protein